MKFLSSYMFNSTLDDWQKYIKSFRVLKSEGLETLIVVKCTSFFKPDKYSINLGDFFDIFSCFIFLSSTVFIKCLNALI